MGDSGADTTRSCSPNTLVQHSQVDTPIVFFSCPSLPPAPHPTAEVIDQAVAAGSVDIGVHSLKDSPVSLPEGVDIAACLPRDDPRDALISLKARTLGECAFVCDAKKAEGFDLTPSAAHTGSALERALTPPSCLLPHNHTCLPQPLRPRLHEHPSLLLLCAHGVSQPTCHMVRVLAQAVCVARRSSSTATHTSTLCQ